MQFITFSSGWAPIAQETDVLDAEPALTLQVGSSESDEEVEVGLNASAKSGSSGKVADNPPELGFKHNLFRLVEWLIIYGILFAAVSLAIYTYRLMG